MTVDSTIDPMQALFVTVCLLASFVPVFTNKTMWNYWSDTYFPRSYLALDNKSTPVDEETKKAQIIATSKRIHVINWFFVPVLDLIGKCFNAAAFYQVIRTYGLVGNGPNYTLMFGMFVAVLALDKGLPAAAHWLVFENWKWVSYAYGFISWGITVSTLVILYVQSNTYLAGNLFIPYTVYNTFVNLSGWIVFWSPDAYKVVPLAPNRNANPRGAFST